MLKRMIMFMLIITFFCRDLNAVNALQKPFVHVGKSIENIDLPLIGKLTNILPFALVAAGLQECPGQSMIAFTGLLIYALFRNERVRELFEKYKAIGLAHLGIKQTIADENDETLFIFDGEDADDAEEEMDMEDELLNDDESDDNDDAFRKKDNVQPQPLKFL